jgi:uncharacterized membrane protein
MASTRAERVRVLLAGESWVSTATHYKGWDHFISASYHLGAEPLVHALKGSRFELTYLPGHLAATDFPQTAEALARYKVVILSDLGANSLLLPPSVFLEGRPARNRLKLLREHVRKGNALLMIGGYYSFQGINGAARYRATPVEEVLPVDIHPYDDRLEIPEGFSAELVEPDHPVLSGIEGKWPLLLGANEVKVKQRDGVRLLARLPRDEGGHPLLVVGPYGKGRAAAWTSDIGPHWLPKAFSDWPGYARLWRQLLGWLAAKD